MGTEVPAAESIAPLNCDIGSDVGGTRSAEMWITASTLPLGRLPGGSPYPTRSMKAISVEPIRSIREQPIGDDPWTAVTRHVSTLGSPFPPVCGPSDPLRTKTFGTDGFHRPPRLTARSSWVIPDNAESPRERVEVRPDGSIPGRAWPPDGPRPIKKVGTLYGATAIIIGWAVAWLRSPGRAHQAEGRRLSLTHLGVWMMYSPARQF